VGHSSPLSTTEDLVRILEDAEVAHAKIVSRLDDSGLDDRLTQKSQQAGERGVFGAPTFFVNGEMFFGNDRLEFIRERLEVA